MKCLEQLDVPALDAFDWLDDLPVVQEPTYYAFPETVTASETTCTVTVTYAVPETYNGVFFYAQSPLGLFTNEELVEIRDRQLGNHRAAMADAIAAQNALTRGGNLKSGRKFALTTSKVTGATATAVSGAWLLGAPGLPTTVAGTTTMSTGGAAGLTMTKVTLGTKGALASSVAVTAAPYALKGGNWLRGRTMDRKIQAIEQWLQSALDAADAALAAAQMAQGLLYQEDDACK